MWVRNARMPLALWPVRSYATKREIQKKRFVLRQDEENVPTYDYSKTKRTDRRIYVWGMAATGALGVKQSLKKQAQKNAHIVHHPSRQSFGERRDVIDVAAGYGFTLFATKRESDEITLFGTGLNTDSQIGYHKYGGITNKPLDLMIYPAPIELPKSNQDEQIRIVKVAAGRAHSVVVSDIGVVYTLGNNAFGQCARPIVEDEVYFPSQTVHRFDGNHLSGDSSEKDEIERVECGQDHTLFLTKAGKVYSCGWGADGQTGLGHYNAAEKPTLVRGDISTEKIVKVSSVVDCVLALNENGDVFGWGNSEYGQLRAENDEQQIHTPKHLKLPKDCGKIVDIATGGSYCLALNENGEVFVWGFGILGLGPNVEFVKEPTRLPSALFGRNEFNPTSRVTSIYSGISHMGAVTDTQDLYMWGRNKVGCLGFGHEKDQYFPFKASVGAKVLSVSCGVDHTVAFCKSFI